MEVGGRRGTGQEALPAPHSRPARAAGMLGGMAAAWGGMAATWGALLLLGGWLLLGQPKLY